MSVKQRLIHVAGVGLMVVLATAVSARPALAVAPGCDSNHPTFIGGPIYGYPDGRTLNALIGLDLVDSSNRKVDLNGVPCAAGGSCPSGYSAVEHINPDLPPEGSTDTTLDRAWGRCASSKITTGFFEIYPKNESGVTTKTRYGAAAHYRQPIIAGTAYNILLRLPVTFEAAGGNTGMVNGYITYNGHKVPPENITRGRAFTLASGPECGIEGFSASADVKTYSASLDATYYRVAYLAGGRCGADSQRYELQIDCSSFCGQAKRTIERQIDISQGSGVRVDIPF